MSVADSEFAFDGIVECVAYEFDRDAIRDDTEEALDDHVHGFVLGESAAHQVEHLFGIDSTCGGSVRAFHIIGFDFQSGNRIDAGVG